MDSTKLETFLVVCRMNSFSKAAEKLFITPAAVKKQIDSLEDEVGVSLFIRKASGVTPTKAGEAFAAEADKILKVMQNSVETVRQVEKSQDYEIHIGHSTRLSFDFISLLTSTFNEQYPNHYLYFERMKKTELSTALENGTVDCFLFINPTSSDFRGIKKTRLGATAVHAVVNRSHPLAGKELIRYEDLFPYQVYIPSMLDSSLYERLEADIGSSLHVMDKSDRNTLAVSLLKKGVILYPGRVTHDVSIPFDCDPLPIVFYYRDRSDSLVDLYHVIRKVLPQQNII